MSHVTNMCWRGYYETGGGGRRDMITDESREYYYKDCGSPQDMIVFYE